MKKGDIISVDYEIWVMDDEESEEKFLLDTTKEELAKSKDIHDEKMNYEPEDFIIGKERPFKFVDDSFLVAKIGKDVELTIPPIDAYGEREMSKIKFRRKDELEILEEEKVLLRGSRVKLKTPVEGLEGEGVVRVNTGRRVNVDFNHPLAGKTILYKYTVVKKYEDVGEILKTLFGTFSPKIGGIDFSTSEDGETLRITLPDICKVDNSWMSAKLVIVNALRESLDFKAIVFEEIYESKKRSESDDSGRDEGTEEDNGAKDSGDTPTGEGTSEPDTEEDEAEEVEPKEDEAEEAEPKEDEAEEVEPKTEITLDLGVGEPDENEGEDGSEKKE